MNHFYTTKNIYIALPNDNGTYLAIATKFKLYILNLNNLSYIYNMTFNSEISVLSWNKKGNLLEIGAGCGNTLIFAKRNGYASKVFGIDIVEIKNSFQKDKSIDGFIIGDIEKIKLDFEENFFDVIICGDVLEHLINPKMVLEKIKKFLKPDGILIASIPNFRQIFILYKIFIKGDFSYTSAGILDETHLRFFCKKNIIELFQKSGWKIEKIVSNCNLIGKTTKLINKITFNIFDEFLAAQYYIIAKK